ncbi:hypothetical protein CRE_30708 [Caenorhabditis remanei]|uniref:Uncharacterized protein n=1 Tax=Caenorhabditis remanei TaxID=31234 RepID=E3LTU6_CAERE|nr:hypothetical protein CRE_30708 [Caenorhabditis remanei]
MSLLFVYLGFNFMVTVFGFTFFWKLFPKNRMEATSRQNDRKCR